MNHRDINEIAQQLRDFMSTDQACQRAAHHLSRGVEIGIRLDDAIDAAFFRSGEKTIVELRKAQKPDVVFSLTAHAADTLIAQKNRNLGELGVEVLKLYISSDVRIRVTGSLFAIMKNGYIGIIKEAGAPFMKFLAAKGVTNLAKIPDVIRRLKKNRAAISEEL